jgi:hypothetical protein
MGTSKKRVEELERKVERRILIWCVIALAIVLIVALVIHFIGR